MATVTMNDVRKAKLCSVGAREWFKMNNLDWSLFLKEGIAEEKLIETGDGMAFKAVEVARERERGL